MRFLEGFTCGVSLNSSMFLNWMLSPRVELEGDQGLGICYLTTWFLRCFSVSFAFIDSNDLERYDGLRSARWQRAAKRRARLATCKKLATGTCKLACLRKVIGILAWDAWKVDQFALFCTPSLGPNCSFETKFLGSWRRLCGIFVICRGGAASWSAHSTHFLECTRCVQPYRLRASMTVFPSICLHFIFWFVCFYMCFCLSLVCGCGFACLPACLIPLHWFTQTWINKCHLVGIQ